MKKFLVLAFIFSLTTTYSNAVELKQEVKPIKDQAVQTKVDFKVNSPSCHFNASKKCYF